MLIGDGLCLEGAAAIAYMSPDDPCCRFPGRALIMFGLIIVERIIKKSPCPNLLPIVSPGKHCMDITISIS